MNPVEEGLKKPCAFIIRIKFPLQTLILISKFLIDRKIQIETMQQNMLNEEEAILILHCKIERDRIKHTQYNLEKLKGIIELELLEGKGTQMVRL
jgi:hypothetical protein